MPGVHGLAEIIGRIVYVDLLRGHAMRQEFAAGDFRKKSGDVWAIAEIAQEARSIYATSKIVGGSIASLPAASERQCHSPRSFCTVFAQQTNRTRDCDLAGAFLRLLFGVAKIVQGPELRGWFESEVSLRIENRFVAQLSIAGRAC